MNSHDTSTRLHQRQQRQAHQSFLLRLWREEGDHAWHASLQNTGTEKTVHFANMDLLFAFLITQIPEDNDTQTS